MEPPKLFPVKHEYACPSPTEAGMKMMGDLVMGSEHWRRSGVRVVSDYLVLGKHRPLIFVESPDPRGAERYAEPFRQIGHVGVYELGRCEAVMAEAMQEFAAAKAVP